jgi:hypothetical protein
VPDGARSDLSYPACLAQRAGEAEEAERMGIVGAVDGASGFTRQIRAWDHTSGGGRIEWLRLQNDITDG